MDAFSQPKINLKGKDGKSQTIEWKLSVSSGPSYGRILVNFEPNGNKMLKLALDMEGAEDEFGSVYLSSASKSEQRILPAQLVKWTTSKIGLPANEERGNFKIKIVIAIDVDILLKKLK